MRILARRVQLLVRGPNNGIVDVGGNEGRGRSGTGGDLCRQPEGRLPVLVKDSRVYHSQVKAHGPVSSWTRQLATQAGEVSPAKQARQGECMQVGRGGGGKEDFEALLPLS